MEPNAPFTGTVIVFGLALLEMKSVDDSKVLAGFVEVNVTLIWQVAGDVSVPRHELPLTAKSAESLPGLLKEAPENVTVPLPVILTVIDCGALLNAKGLPDRGVPVGTPKDRSPGDAETEAD